MLKCVGDEVLDFKEINTETQTALVAEGCVCFTTKIILTGPASLTMDIPATFRAEYYDWQGGSLIDENRPIHVSVSGPGQAQALVLTTVNGQTEFDFVSEVPGTFVIRATAEFPCDPAEVEVVVS